MTVSCYAQTRDKEALKALTRVAMNNLVTCEQNRIVVSPEAIEVIAMRKEFTREFIDSLQDATAIAPGEPVIVEFQNG